MKTKEVVAYHGGISWDVSGFDFKKRSKLVVADVLDAPFDPSPKSIKVLTDTGYDNLLRESPPTHAEELVSTISKVRSVKREHIIVSSGSSSIIFSMFPVLFKSGSNLLLLKPTYSEYEHTLKNVCDRCTIGFVRVGKVESVAGDILKKLTMNSYDGIIIVNPNNPTGTVLRGEDIKQILQAAPNTIVWVDECYVDFLEGSGWSVEPLIPLYENLIVVKSLSKCLSLSGARVAHIEGDSECIECR